MIGVEVLEKLGISGFGSAFVLVAVAIGTALYKLFQAGKQGRKECLELWDRNKIDDPFWLESFFHHRFGQRPAPADLLREAVTAKSPSRPLNDLAMNWRYFEGASLADLTWKMKCRERKLVRTLEQLVLLMLYVAFVAAGVKLFYIPMLEAKALGSTSILLGASSFWTLLQVGGAAGALSRLRSLGMQARNIEVEVNLLQAPVAVPDE